MLIAMSDDEATHPESDGSAHVTPQRLPSPSNLASPVPLPLSSEGAGPSSEGLADGPIAHRLRPLRKPAGYIRTCTIRSSLCEYVNQLDDEIEISLRFHILH